MPITPFLYGKAFGPETLHSMSAAFEAVLEELGASKSDPCAPIIAKKIIELAERGEHDPLRLHDRALAELER